jgi:Mg-chelatase subunit ChlD|eukprot:COSAG02_NODE_2705_length_8192_cov_49.489806_2_plen_138_part_00
MNALNRARLKDFVSTLEPSGGTDFKAGFSMAFDILDEAERMGETSNCQSVILFMTDGDAPDPSTIVNSRNGGPYHSTHPNTEAGRYTRIFTYAFGEGAETGSMRSVACENGGVFHQITDDDGPRLKEIMANYFVRTQ